MRGPLAIVCAGLLVAVAPARADEAPPADATPTATAPAELPALTATTGSTVSPEPTATSTPTAAPTPATTATPTASPAATAAVTSTPTPAVAAPRAVATAAASQRIVASPAQATATPEPPAAPIPTATPAPAPPQACALRDESDHTCVVPSTACSLFGTDGDDILVGTPWHDVLCGFGGNDQIEGGDGDDTLIGGDGNDVLIGGEGDDCTVGGPGVDSADTTSGELTDVERSGDRDNGDIMRVDAEGRCALAGGAEQGAVPRPFPPDIVGPLAGAQPVVARHGGPGAGAGAATASSPASVPARVLVSFPGSATLTVKQGRFRLRVACAATTPAELVMVAGSQRIAHRRFTCTPPERVLHVHLNKAGRALTARHDKVSADVLVLAGAQTAQRPVKLVSRRG